MLVYSYTAVCYNILNYMTTIARDVPTCIINAYS